MERAVAKLTGWRWSGRCAKNVMEAGSVAKLQLGRYRVSNGRRASRCARPAAIRAVRAASLQCFPATPSRSQARNRTQLLLGRQARGSQFKRAVDFALATHGVDHCSAQVWFASVVEGVSSQASRHASVIHIARTSSSAG